MTSQFVLFSFKIEWILRGSEWGSDQRSTDGLHRRFCRKTRSWTKAATVYVSVDAESRKEGGSHGMLYYCEIYVNTIRE